MTPVTVEPRRTWWPRWCDAYDDAYAVSGRFPTACREATRAVWWIEPTAEPDTGDAA